MLEAAGRHNPGLDNVEWLRGDGVSLAGIEAAGVDVCISHVVFQHIPDPAITLGYVREMGRVLRAGGWAAFQVSNDPAPHRPPAATRRGRRAVSAVLGRAPRGQRDPRWLGSMVELDALHAAVHQGSMEIERIAGQGTQMCAVLTRRSATGSA
jgi:SAM-dependent methyltransferase